MTWQLLIKVSSAYLLILCLLTHSKVVSSASPVLAREKRKINQVLQTLRGKLTKERQTTRRCQGKHCSILEVCDHLEYSIHTLVDTLMKHDYDLIYECSC